MIDYEKTMAWRSGDVRHSYTAKDTILYALGLGLGADPMDPAQLRLTYEKDLQTLPTMAAVLASPGFWMKERTELGIDYLKLVHGGLRYLKEGKVMLTRHAVHEREQLLHEGPGLIDPLGFLMTVYKGDFPGRWTYEMGLTVYDLLALRWDHAYYSPQDFRLLAPHISQDDLQGGFRFGDEIGRAHV